ncbi:GNAT family N-acetyltransferase [Elioraea rosea]|uniref:GNAT family N-acetyltransferase n=1 Tax=Elioraea rosea TaxID=2492390 RepID=UPI0011841164|nr:GNAT family N-acetyltransferase [Elioraea rosea]
MALSVPELDTPRLHLRGHRPDDFEPYAAMWADPNVVRYIGGAPVTREAAWTRFLRHAGLWHFLGFGYFAVEEKATGAFVGQVGFQDLRRAITPSIEGTMEAGWVIAPVAQGQGYAIEAMRAALAWADAAWPVPRMTCIIEPSHAVSLAIAAKLGFVEFARADGQGSQLVLLERRRQGDQASAGEAARS